MGVEKFLFPLLLSFLLSSCVSLPRNDQALVDVSTLSEGVLFDLRYATENNRTGLKLYESKQCLLRTGTVRKLLNVQKELQKQKLRLKIWDAYRPLSVQKILWETVPDDRYVTPPWKGSDHNRGVAVDVTLTDWEGKELEMGTPFDYLSRAAWVEFPNLTKIEQANRKKLREVMRKNGFLAIPTEWWHFYDSEWSHYEILDVKSSSFVRGDLQKS